MSSGTSALVSNANYSLVVEVFGTIRTGVLQGERAGEKPSLNPEASEFVPGLGVGVEALALSETAARPSDRKSVV
jgi:hypothetical protein